MRKKIETRKKFGRICALVVVGMFVAMTSMSVPADDPDDWTMWGDNTNGWEFLGTLNNDDLRIITNGMQRMVVTSGGNVGIGTANPQYTLDVDGIIHASGPLKIGNSIVIDGVNDRITATGGTIDFDDENLVTTGNVGIGTINPDSLLHVSAGDEGDAELILESNTDDNNNADNPCITFRQDGNDVNAFIAMVGDFNARVQGTLPDALVIGSGDNSPAVQFATDDEVRMTIWVNGMVGIGTIWPDATLDVAGDVVIDDSLTVDANTLHVDHINNRVGIGIANPQFTLDVDGGIHATGELIIGNSITIDGINDKITATGGTIDFDDENLVTTGNVGIGTTSPLDLLHVKGSNAAVRIERTSGAAPSVHLKNEGGQSASIYLGGTGTTSENNLTFSNRNEGKDLVFKNRGFEEEFVSEKMRITSDGNVGIGTNNPQGALDIVSTTGALIVPRMTTAQRNALAGVNGMIVYDTTANQFYFYENGAWTNNV